jgi:hypothetical protein
MPSSRFPKLILPFFIFFLFGSSFLVQTAGIGLIVVADAPEDKVPTIVALNLTACSMLYYAGWTKGENPSNSPKANHNGKTFCLVLSLLKSLCCLKTFSMGSPLRSTILHLSVAPKGCPRLHSNDHQTSHSFSQHFQ